MPVVNQQIVDNIVKQLKSQGIFDQFRKDCLADVDTKPSYQNLRQRVEGYVSKFLSQQTWNPSLNKNQLRDELRRQINESGMLSIGVEHVVDQIVNSKANRVFLPQIEIAARRYLGLDRDQNDSEDNEHGAKDEKDIGRITTSDVKETTQNGIRELAISEVPSQTIVQDKAQDTVIHIAEECKLETGDPQEMVSSKHCQKDYDRYAILNTSRETETTVSGDDELLPPGVDFASPVKKLVETEEFVKGEDTSSSFNSEPLVIYDPQASSNENSRELPESNNESPSEEQKESTILQSNLNFKTKEIESETSFDDLLKTQPRALEKTNVELETQDEKNTVAETVENKTAADTDDKKSSLENEIKKLLELGDKEKMEQEIRRILEIESKKMVEKELKKRESIEAAKFQNEEAKFSSMENSRSNSSTDLTKEKSKTEKLKEISKNESLSSSNSSSDNFKEKRLSKTDKIKSLDGSGKSSSKYDSLKSKGNKSDEATKRTDSKSSKSSSKPSPSKWKPEKKNESKSSSDKSKSSSKQKSPTVKSSSKLSDSRIAKSSEVSKPTALNSGGTTKPDISSKASKLEPQTVKEKSRFVPVKANIVKPVSKHSLKIGKDASIKISQDKDKTHGKDGSKKDPATKAKTSEKKDNQSHIFKSPDNRSSPEKKVEIESSETDDDFIRALNNSKKGENIKEDEDKKSDVSVSSVHTSDLSSFDDEISLSSEEELKTIPTPLKENKKLPLKDIKEISTTISKDKQGSGRSSLVLTEELEKKVDSYQSVDDSSSQREDLTSETQTDDDDKGRRSGLRRQRKLNPKYASDEYSSIFNKTRRERKSTDDSKQNKSLNNTEITESRKRRYSRTQERHSSKGGDSESETLVKSSKMESTTSKGTRGRQSKS